MNPASHSGNVHFLYFVSRFRCEYVAVDRRRRWTVAHKVLKAIEAQKPPGRFLEGKLGSIVPFNYCNHILCQSF
jgi:hypothetical protein